MFSIKYSSFYVYHLEFTGKGSKWPNRVTDEDILNVSKYDHG